MTRLSQQEIELMDMLIETVDHYLHQHKDYTTKSTYQLVSEYFSQLADNETTEEVYIYSAYELLGDLINNHSKQSLYDVLERLVKKNVIMMKYTQRPHQRNVLKNLYIKIVQ